MGLCSVEGCDKRSRVNGYCPMHASRVRRHGSPEARRWTHGTPEERFWRKTEKAAPDECWMWTGGGHKFYGSFLIGGRGAPRKLAHRFSYELHKGPIPDGMLVMHICDNPRCVNPAHLKLGTPKQNMEDMFAKGRQRPVAHRGEKNGFAVLTEDVVRVIRASQLPTTVLAKALGVSEGAVRDVRKGRTWTHVT